MGGRISVCDLCDGREEVEIASGIVEAFYFGKDADGEYCIWGREHDVVYYPRYCPACGRRLRNEK